jgi:TRAP-type C4-dicarboxylate transport system permease large subunit
LAPDVEEFNWPVARAALVKAWRPVLLFALVLGGLYGGMFTTQEAASVGALLAFVFAVSTKGFTLEKFKASLIDTAINAGAIYVIFIGANIFASFMSFTDIAQLVLSIIDLETMPKWLILFGLVVFYLLLGTVFDTLAAVLVTTPLVVPLIIGMDYDLIWWGVVTLSLVEIGMITPPLGMNVFVMRSVVGDRLPLSTIFRGVTPFLVADLIRVILLTSFPIITMWLPSVLSGN